MEMLFDLVRIMMINIVLSGDNAIVIAMCCRTLPPEKRTRAMLCGSIGAVGLRLVMTVTAVYLLTVPYLGFIGGVLLLWIASKLLQAEDSAEPADLRYSFLEAVKTILVADVVMSLDNTLAIAAVAQGNIPMLALGFAISIPVIFWGSRIVISIMEKYPGLIYGGALLIAWTAGDLIVHDQQMGGYILAITQNWSANLCAVGIFAVIGHWKSRMRENRFVE